MKTINIQYILFITGILFLASCEKVIQVDLNSKDPQLVIEATIANDSTPCIVNITKTVNFSQRNTFPGVAGALVTLSDNSGNTENLQMTTTPGVYQSVTMKGIEGRTYAIHVVLNNKSYDATSTMPQHVLIDELTYDSIGFFGNLRYQAVPHIHDPKGIKNYYRFHLFVNGERDKTNLVQDDEFTDGNEVTRPLFADLDINKGDTVRVDMLCVDQPVYKYFFSLSQSQDGSATPANPVSNFSGGCLGYFSAYTFDTKTIIIN